MAHAGASRLAARRHRAFTHPGALGRLVMTGLPEAPSTRDGFAVVTVQLGYAPQHGCIAYGCERI